jgi:acetyl esterase
MNMHPETVSYLARPEDRPRWEELPVEEARELARKWHLEHATFNPATLPARSGVRVQDVLVPGPAGVIPVRLYRPQEAGSRHLPLVEFFHGGGWVIGDLDTHDQLCRELCWRVPAIIAAAHYRRAPEHRFPSAVDDCIAVSRWLGVEAASFGGDATRIAVAGDSAGGNLATVVARGALFQRVPPVRFQVLIYPVTDNTKRLRSSNSARLYGEGLELTMPALEWFQDQYLGDQDVRAHPDASPLLADDLSGISPALVIMAELDPIADSVVAYADKMSAAGTAVRLVNFPGVMHAFVTMGSFFSAADWAMDEAVGALQQALMA